MKVNYRKTLSFILALLISTIFVSLDVKNVHAAWPTTTASRCWTAGPGLYLQAQITPTGGGYYTIGGIVVENKHIGNMMSGAAYVRGMSVYMTVSTAGKNSIAMWTGQGYVVFNKSTLVGKYEDIGHDKNYVDGSLDT